jgi:hypothetical protein
VKQLPLDMLSHVATPAAHSGKQPSAATSEPQGQLRQALWQLLLPIPEGAPAALSGEHGPSAAGGSAPSAEQGPSRDSTSRATQRASELAATAYLLAGHVQQLRLYAAAEGGGPSAPDQAFSIRVEAANERGGLATVELSHPELGPVTLSIELSEGAVRVTATASNPRSAEVIAQGQAALAARLLRLGVALEALDVVVVRRKKKDARSGNRARSRARRQES